MTELICIVCPQGCRLQVDEQNSYKVTGHTCPSGEAYGKKELAHPTRVLTSIVHIDNALHACCPVKTSRDIPKGDIRKAMDLLKTIRLQAPVAIGDVVVRDICGSGADWVVTKIMAKEDRA